MYAEHPDVCLESGQTSKDFRSSSLVSIDTLGAYGVATIIESWTSLLV